MARAMPDHAGRMPPWRRTRLATRLTLLVMALALPLLGVLLATALSGVDERRKAEGDSTFAIAQSLASSLDAFTSDVQITSIVLSQALGAAGHDPTQAADGALLDRVVSEYRLLRAVFVTDPAGRVTAAQGGAGIGVDISSRPYIRALQSGADSVWSGALQGLQTGEITVVFARRLPPGEEVPRAFMVFAFRPEDLVQRYPVSLPPDAQIAVVDRTGTLLYPTVARGDSDSAFEMEALPEMRQALSGMTVRLNGVTLPFAEGERVGALVPMPTTGWIVAYTRPRAVVETAVWSRFMEQAVGVVAVLSVTALVAVIVARRLVKPLGVLAAAAGGIARGERTTIPAVQADVEVTQLADAMRSMSVAVAHREEALNAAVQARDEFLSVAAHELRTPVAGIRGTAQLALRAIQHGTFDAVRAERHLRSIVQATDRLGEMVSDLLDLSRLQSGRFPIRAASVDLTGLVTGVVDDHRERDGGAHVIKTNLPDTPIVLEVDPGRVEQILDNFLENARKYTPADGEICVSLEPSDGGVTLEVVDTGIGLPDGDEERIFHPFGRASNALATNIPGLGLGLSICREIAAALGGRVWAESDGEGAGTAVCLWLPRRHTGSANQHLR